MQHQEPPPQAALQPVPHPDLAAVEETVRRRMEERRTQAEAAMDVSHEDPRAAAGQMAELGRFYLAYGFPDASRVCFANARRLEPEDYRWPYFLGVLSTDGGDPAATAAHFERALSLKPRDLATLIRLGDARLAEGQLEAAGGSFEEALSADPESAAALYGLGKVASAQGDYPAAIHAYLEALARQPQAAVVRYSLGQAYRKNGQREEARSYLADWDDTPVEFPDPLMEGLGNVVNLTALEVVQDLLKAPGDFTDDSLGFALSRLTDVEGAVEELQRAVAEKTAGASRNPVEEARFHYVIAALLARRDETEKALRSFQAAVEADPGFVSAYMKFGNALGRMERFQEAIVQYSAVLVRDPDHRDALIRRATARANLGESSLALLDLERLKELAPQDGGVRLRLGTALERLGRQDEAFLHYNQALALELEERDRVLVHLALGNLRQRQGLFSEAMGEYRNALDIQPDFSEAEFQLAGVLGHIGRYSEAVSSYARVRARRPQQVSAWRGEVTALLLMADYAEARERLEEGLLALPGHPALGHLLARLLASAPVSEVRDGPRALEIIQALVDGGQNVERMETLAMALAETGQVERALEIQHRLVRQAEVAGQSQLGRALERRLAAYRGGRPWRAGGAEDLIVEAARE